MNAINSNIITYKKANLALSEVEWANSNPIKANLKRAKMNVNLTLTKDYRKKDDFVVRINKPNSNPISERLKMNVNAFLQKDYENETAFRPQKNKPNQTQSTPSLSASKSAKKTRSLRYSTFPYGC